jgi:ATP-dependent DNA helicase RecG
MLANRSDLLDKIRLGEDSFLELKEARFAGGKLRGPTQDVLADELAAFANAAGGELLLGVEDASREIVGIPLDRLDDVERVVRDACEQSVKPPLMPIIERITLPDLGGTERPVLRVAVARSLFVHLSPGGYFHRVGSSKRPIHPEQLGRLIQQRSQSRLIRFDETPVLRASLTDLREDLWRRFAPESTTDTADVLLGKLAMAGRDDDGVLHPTVTGLLLGSEAPHQHLPGAFVQAVGYRGVSVVPEDDGAYQNDAQDITGPLDRQILDACAFVRRNMRISAVKHEGGGREDLPQFSMLAVFEAITNAVAHRDYSMPGSKVRLRLFSDRLEIYSPGMLPNTMTTDSIAFRQAARNEAITSLLARCPVNDASVNAHRQHIMDKRGEGVPIILSASEHLSGRRPAYTLIDDSELLLTIFAANPEPHP